MRFLILRIVSPVVRQILVDDHRIKNQSNIYSKTQRIIIDSKLDPQRIALSEPHNDPERNFTLSHDDFENIEYQNIKAKNIPASDIRKSLYFFKTLIRLF